MARKFKMAATAAILNIGLLPKFMGLYNHHTQTCTQKFLIGAAVFHEICIVNTIQDGSQISDLEYHTVWKNRRPTSKKFS
jgi:hypothetical protein